LDSVKIWNFTQPLNNNTDSQYSTVALDGSMKRKEEEKEVTKVGNPISREFLLEGKVREIEINNISIAMTGTSVEKLIKPNFIGSKCRRFRIQWNINAITGKGDLKEPMPNYYIYKTRYTFIPGLIQDYFAEF